jgi:uncharacterized protein
MKVGLADVENLARGAAILGCGGGGDPYLGSLMLRQAIRDCGPVEVINVEDVSNEDFVVPFAMMGAPTVQVEKIPNGSEMVAALRGLEKSRNAKASAILCAEIGGINALLPLVLAARTGLPVVDGDGMGRAFPELQMVSFHIFGVTAAPMVMTDEYGNSVLFECAKSVDVERLARPVVVAMGGSSAICVFSMRGADAKRSMVRGTISLAVGLGATIRDARRREGDPFDAVLEYLRTTPYYQNCRVLFEGKTVDLLRETKGGFAVGRAVIGGTASCVGRTLEVQFQNEHLVAREANRIRTIVPDLISILDSASAEPLTTEALKYGQRVKVLGISAAPIMRSSQALEVFGPQAFGLNEPFTPIELLNSQ